MTTAKINNLKNESSKRKLKKHIGFRVSNIDFLAVENLSKKNNVTKSDMFRKLMTFYINNSKNK